MGSGGGCSFASAPLCTSPLGFWSLNNNNYLLAERGGAACIPLVLEAPRRPQFGSLSFLSNAEPFSATKLQRGAGGCRDPPVPANPPLPNRYISASALPPGNPGCALSALPGPSTPTLHCSSQLNLGQLIPANSVLSLLYLLLNLTNLTFMVR